MPHLLLAGHFGCGNLGDDAIMLGFVEQIGREFDITVMSGAPEETFRHYGLRSINRKDASAFVQELERTDALVFPGGSIFQDVTSVRSVGYYAGLIRRAKKQGKKVFLVGQGIGPLTRFFGRRAAASALNMAEIIVVRDPQSPTTLKELGVKVPIRVAADPAFLLPVPKESEDGGFKVGDRKTVGIAPRPTGELNKTQVQVFGDFARMLYQNNCVPVLIEMDHKFDGPLIVEIGKAQGGKVPDIRKMNTPMQVQGRLQRMDAVVAVRLHAGILATTVGVPTLMVAYDPKVTAFAKMLGICDPMQIEGLTAQRLFDQTMVFMRDREKHTRIVERKREEFRQAAMLNVEVVRDGLKSRVS